MLASRATRAGHSRGTGRLLGVVVAVLLLSGGLLTWRLLGVGKQPAVPASASAGVDSPSGSPAPSHTMASTRPAPAAQADPAPADEPATTPVSGPPTAPVAAPPAIVEEWPLPHQDVAAEETAAAPSPASGEKPAGVPPAAAPPAAAGTAATPPAAAGTVAAAQAPAATAAPKPASPAFDASQYKLGGVVLGDDGGTAILNGRLVQVGEMIDGAKVVKITARAVHLEFAGQVFVVGS